MAFRRIAAALMVLVMAGAAFTGCADKNEDAAPKKTKGSTSEAEEDVEETTKRTRERKPKTDEDIVEDTLKDYVSYCDDPEKTDDYLQLFYPAAILEWDEDIYNSLFDERYECAADIAENYKKISLKEVTMTKPLEEDALRGAEIYYRQIPEKLGIDDPESLDFEVEKGYYVKFKVEYLDNDGDKDTELFRNCVVWVKDNGWKIIYYTSDDLIELYDESET